MMLANINYYEVFNFLLNFPQILLYYGCEELYGIITGFVKHPHTAQKVTKI